MKQNENTKYVKLGITGAAVLAFGFAIMYILNQSKNIAAGIQLVFNILKPFLYGALIAYLLAPICNRMDERFLKWFPKATEKQKKGLKFLSIAIAVICAVTIVVLLILLILPQVWDSTVKIIKILPARLAYCNRMIDQLLKDQPELQTYFNHFSSQVENGLNDVLKANSSMMTTIQGIVNNITVQLIEVLSVFKNMFLGFLIAVYLLASRKLFGAQAKLLLYGIFPNKWAKIIEEEVHYTDKMFNGFFVGKIIDSAIIGLICFAGTTLCALLLLLGSNPWDALYFLIFIVILQQVDGNIIGPKILGNTTGVSSFWVLFSILLFGGLWGLVGMVIAVPLFGVIYDIIRKLTARGLKRNRHEEMMQEYNEKFHEEPEETETTQKDTFSKKINAKINEYIDKNVNNK